MDDENYPSKINAGGRPSQMEISMALEIEDKGFVDIFRRPVPEKLSTYR